MGEDADIDVYSTDGALLNTVAIKDMRVFVSYASCPDKLCAKHKPLDGRDAGEPIVCLPNKVTVEVTER